MKILKINISVCFLLISALSSSAQTYQIKDIKSFGAKGDGKTNDHEAFEKAASYFNKRGGHGTLSIPPGTYIVGKQTFTGGKPGKPAYEGSSVLYLINIKNFKIQGSSKSVLRYDTGFRFGAFDPENGLSHEHGNNRFVNYSYAAYLAMCIFFDSCKNITINNLELDGNSQALILGGTYGDVGLQVPHHGIFIRNSSKVLVDSIYVHHFGTDGIYISNKPSINKDDLKIENSAFEYNGRQGLSWVGGNSLLVRNCKFNHTGKSKFYSPPSAGIDIEAQSGPVRNGIFENCEIINNRGVGVVADKGNSAACLFKNCTFWGATNWSVWVTAPEFTFTACEFYGSFVHGYDAPDDKKATKFISCNFEDKLYNGKEPFGNYLVESNGKKRVSFTNCTFTANKKKLIWMDLRAIGKPEEKYQFTDCYFLIKNNNYRDRDFIAILKGLRLKNCVFDFKFPGAKQKGNYLSGYGSNNNVDAGGNKVIYSGDKL